MGLQQKGCFTSVGIGDWQYFGRALGIGRVTIIDSLGSVVVLLGCNEGGSFLTVRLDWTCHCSCSSMGECVSLRPKRSGFGSFRIGRRRGAQICKVVGSCRSLCSSKHCETGSIGSDLGCRREDEEHGIFDILLCCICL